MKVSRGDFGRMWLVLDDGTGINQEAAGVALRIPREVLEHFAEHGTLPPVAQPGEAPADKETP